MKSRRRLLAAAALGALVPAWVSAQARPVKIGMLSSRPLAGSLYASAIVQRLAELGYREEAGTKLEFRSADTRIDRYSRLARELVDLKCDLIFAVGSELAASSLRDRRSGIPIVFLAADYDPLAGGLVESLARPGGSITGVFMPAGELVAKRVELLHEVVPGARRFAVLVDPPSQRLLASARQAAERARVELIVTEFSKPPYDFEGALGSARRAGAEGLIVPPSPVFAANVPELAALAARHRLPSAGFIGFAEAGLLLTYSIDNRKAAARVAELGAKVLKGAKPADIPVEQPDEYVLVVNLKTAKALGVKIPYPVLARATKLIE